MYANGSVLSTKTSKACSSNKCSGPQLFKVLTECSSLVHCSRSPESVVLIELNMVLCFIGVQPEDNVAAQDERVCFVVCLLGGEVSVCGVDGREAFGVHGCGGWFLKSHFWAISQT